MDVRAAVATAAGKPLETTTVQLEGPRECEVMVEIKATGVCEINNAFELMKRGESIRGVVTFQYWIAVELELTTLPGRDRRSSRDRCRS